MGFWSNLFKSSTNNKNNYEKRKEALLHESANQKIEIDEEARVERIKTAMGVMKRYSYSPRDNQFRDIGEYITEKKKTSVLEIKRAFPDFHPRMIELGLYQLKNTGIISIKGETIYSIFDAQEFSTLIKIQTQIGGRYDHRLIGLGAAFSSDLKEIGIDERATTMLRYRFELEADYQENNANKLLSHGSGIIHRAENDAYINFIRLLLSKCMPSKIRLILISPDRRFSQFEGFPQLLIPPIFGEPDTFFDYLNTEIFLRRQAAAGVSSYDSRSDYGFTVSTDIDPLPYILIFDEISRFKKTKSFISTLESIALYGKECAIGFIGFTAFNGSSLRLGRLKQFLYFRDAQWSLNVFESYEPKELSDTRTFDSMSGEEFEKACAELLSQNGFNNIQLTSKSWDYGGDILAEKDQIKYVIQCKRYNSSIGVSAVQEVIASRSIYKCHVGVVLTNSVFTKAAEVLAEENNIILWDGNYLNRMLDD